MSASKRIPSSTQMNRKETEHIINGTPYPNAKIQYFLELELNTKTVTRYK